MHAYFIKLASHSQIHIRVYTGESRVSQHRHYHRTAAFDFTVKGCLVVQLRAVRLRQRQESSVFLVVPDSPV